MSQPRILVVEDEERLAEVLADNLELEGWTTEVVHDGEAALAAVRRLEPTLVLLDVMLPGKDGFEVCAHLRREGCEVPVLFLTARGEQDDRLRGLELGGDDYLAKPFDLRELILRIKAILKRTRWMASPSSAGESLTLGRAVIDFRAFSVRIDGRETRLSTKETMILRVLAERAGAVVSRAEILDHVWGYDAFPTTRTIDNFIVRLRRLLEPDPAEPRYLHTIRGTGYRLTP